MKQSIILKTLIILSIVIGTIFIASSYLFSKNDSALISDIREYNLNSSMNALDERLTERLAINKKQMKDTASMIAKNSSTFLLNYDSDGLEESLYFDMKKDGIKAVKIFDNSAKEIFIVGLKLSKKIEFKTFVPTEVFKYSSIKRPINIISDNSMDRIGYITLYYDESIIVDKINQLKSKTKKDIASFNHVIDEQKSKSDKVKLYINFGSLITILILIYILLMYFVNKPLKIVQSGLDDFFMFLQNKQDSVDKINLDSNDEFGQMAQSLNENIIVSARLHEEIHELNTNLEARIEEKTAKVTTLLNNAGQGFLTFDKEFIIDAEYSKECEKLLGKAIAHNDIASILFQNSNKVESFKNNILDMLDTNNSMARKSMISLLPNEVILNKRALKLEYKILEDSNIMLILTNISSQKKLERKVKKEQSILKMIVTIIGDSDVFYDVKKDFEYFIDNLQNNVNMKKTSLYNINELYRAIHTFKGSFLQLFMNDTAKKLHEVESQLSEFLIDSTKITNDDILEFLLDTEFKLFMNSDLNNINELLGQEFLNNDNFVSIDRETIKNIENQYISLIQNNHIENETSNCLLDDIKCLSQKSLKSQLNSYPRLTLQTAQRLEKEVYEFEIIGDDDVLISDNHKPFIKSLIHLFRNSVDHGIETPEQRDELEKDEIGTISCSFTNDNDKIKIIISDDGAGINVEKIKEKISSSIDTSTLTDDEVYQYIFQDNLSTKDEVTDTSGRGVGMSAVKAELEKLNGTIKIQSELNIGTTFVFEIDQ